MEALSNSKCIFAVLLLALFSCKSSETEEIRGNTFTGERNLRISATISSGTKTSLDGMEVKWNNDDVIGVFTSYDNVPSCFTLDSGDGSSSAVFTGNLAGTPEIAKYPYRTDDRYENGVISTDIYDQQAYLPGTFASGVSPMAGLPDGKGNYIFRNLCSVVRLTLTGTDKVEEIVLTSDDEDCYFAGPAKIRLDNGNPVLTIEPLNTKTVDHVVGDGYPSVHLNCGGVQLSPVMRNTFLVVVPSQVYETGILIEVCTKLGKISKRTGKIDLKSSTMYDIDPFEVIINGGVEPSEFLKGEGNQESPYLVSSLGDLLHIKKAVSNSLFITREDGDVGKFPESAWYQMTEDIDLSECCGPEVGSWTPLFGTEKIFNGHFDGNGHKITGLYVNNPEGVGNFFGDVYIGGYLGNLEVVGNVTADEASIFFGSNSGTVENCISRGTVTGTSFVSGLAQGNGKLIRSCVNYADVVCTGTIYNATGGISSDGISCVYDNCVNYGKITAKTGNCLGGGIAGRIQQSSIINCCNYGEITAIAHAAGIVGSAWDSDIINCANYGNIHGTNAGSSLCGGICAEVTDPFSHRTGSIKNCINVGSVDNGKSNCAICAKNVRIVQYCYWLSTVNTGVSGGTNSGLVSLSSSQMKGETSSPSMYSGYKSPVDALNAFGFDNSTSDVNLQGWMYDSQTGWPVLTGRPALPPGQLDRFIKTSPVSFTLNTYSQSIELSVTSSSEVSLTFPDWISQKSSKTELNGIIMYTKFVLEVKQNKSGVQRTGTIIVQSTDDCSADVAVVQRYTYVSEDYSRDGNVVTIQKASEGAGIDIVLMGDAYTDEDIKSGKYESDIRRGIEGFFSVEPYASFRNLFNIYYVELVSSSREIGSSTALSTYFGSGSHVGGNDNKVRQICTSVTKKSNLDDVTAIVIVNAQRYAGTCYMYYVYTGDCGLGFTVSYFPLGTASSGTSSLEALIRHEAAGHGFGKLADEYSYQNKGTIPDSEINIYRTTQRFNWWPNVDFTSDPFSVLWSKYIKDNRYASERIDVYEGGATYWSGVWRPTENSIMRYNTGQFNAPSREAIYYKIHRLAYGSSWTYDHEEFVEYDAVNRSSAAYAASAVSADEVASFIPTHPPVIVK